MADGCAESHCIRAAIGWIYFRALGGGMLFDMASQCAQDGEKVVYSKYAGTELKVSGTEYVILKVRMLKYTIGQDVIEYADDLYCMQQNHGHAKRCC